MSAEMQYYIGIDFGSHFTRAVVLSDSGNAIKLFDLVELPVEEVFENRTERYKAGLIDVANYLKSKKIILKSAVTNLDNSYIRAVPHVVEIKNRIPFQSVPGSLLRYARKKAMMPNIEPDEKIVDQYLGSLSIDGKKTLDTMRLNGKRLRQDSISIVTKASDYVDLMNASHETGIHIEEVVPSNLTPLYLLEKNSLSPKEHSLYIDFGARITNVCFFNQQRVLAVENFESGSDDITRMISEELGIDFATAEKYKCDPIFMKELEQSESKSYKRLRRRIQNECLVLLQLISHFSQKYGFEADQLRNIIISGGGAKLASLQREIIDFFQKPCEQVGEKSFKYFLNYKVTPEISCAIGLAYSSYLKRKDKVRPKSISDIIANYFQEKIENLLFAD